MATTGALTDFGEVTSLNYLTTGSGTKYLALFSTAVAEDGTGTELAGAWYARKPVTFTAAATVAGVSSTSNSANVDFGTVTGVDAAVNSWALFDAATGGNPWVYGAFTTAKTASVGTNILIQTGDIVISAD